jgi:NAD(P)-dependent dehydrogenase (short-subunit alcohol dehydrogenase family)
VTLQGKVAIVTGASRGIGRGLAVGLAAAGAQVVCAARTTAANPAELPGTIDETAATIRENGGEAVAVRCDIGSAEDISALVDATLAEFGRVDVLVNNVGAVKIRLDGFFGTSDEEFEWAMQMNFFIAVRTTRAALTAMVEAGSGAIVNIASVNAFFQPDAGTIDYGAAKAALVNFAKTLSQEFGPKGIRVNSVSPGPVATDLWLGKGGVADTVATATGTDAATAREQVVAGIGGFATGNFTQPEEVANIVAFLASERSANVTGANYLIDGGLIKTT